MSVATAEPRYLTTADLANRFRVAPSTVRCWRHVGWGPRGIKIRGKVLYREAEVERFERQLAAEQLGEVQ
jgi:Helix-turn-helix domain